VLDGSWRSSREAHRITGEYVWSDWEALRVAEDDS
jgi:hypothetical protein